MGLERIWYLKAQISATLGCQHSVRETLVSHKALRQYPMYTYMWYNTYVSIYIYICGVLVSLSAQTSGVTLQAGGAFPREPVITSALFSLSVTVHQLTVARKYSLLGHRRRRRQGSTHALGKSNPEGGTPTPFFTHFTYSAENGTFSCYVDEIVICIE